MGAIAAALFATLSTAFVRAQQPAPDLILCNGKIITVDERFSISQALAIRGSATPVAPDALGTSHFSRGRCGTITRTDRFFTSINFSGRVQRQI
jgi:hypothetical protein